jgi:cytochrome P450
MPSIQDTVHNYEKIEGPKTVLKLAVKTYVEDMKESSPGGFIPSSFLERTIKHIKIFLFAGHDTTATTLAHCFWLLHQHPDKAAKVRKEHDEVIGMDPAAAADLIAEEPTLLNRLTYTGAVLREALRLFPPLGGTIRQTPENFYLVHPETGFRYPTHGFMLHSSAATIGRDPKYWPEADSFIPERWLIRDEDDPYYPQKNTWRPFELGPRNCIGQELVNLEVRLILALTAREFDFKSGYEAGAPQFMGEIAYQVSVPDHPASAHIKDNLPVLVRSRKGSD